MISGIGVYYPNRQENQRVGIIPDIEVISIIEGIKKGKNKLLEKAIEIINKPISLVKKDLFKNYSFCYHWKGINVLCHFDSL